LAHKVQFTADGLKDAKHLPKGVRNSLAKALKNKLAVNPLRCSEELREPLAGWRSFHYGKYRVIFKLYEEMKLIAIAGIGEHSSQPTRDIYRKLELLAKRGRLAEDILAALRGFSTGEQRKCAQHPAC
jgi:mRNA-degrading endonuclease RelE of RelBE toxin-antitoxin system